MVAGDSERDGAAEWKRDDTVDSERDGMAELERDDTVDWERDGTVVPGVEPARRFQRGSHVNRQLLTFQTTS